MTARAELEKRITHERERVAALRNEIERKEAFILGLQEALKIFPRDTLTAPYGGRRPRSRSDVQKARQLLSTMNGAHHVSDILKGIGKEDTKQNRASLSSSLARYARKGEIFQREGPNEFSLINGGSGEEAAAGQEVQNGATHLQIPPIFGADR